jgi:cobalt-zinc-cadmium efflux system membrane fusion protein
MSLQPKPALMRPRIRWRFSLVAAAVLGCRSDAPRAEVAPPAEPGVVTIAENAPFVATDSVRRGGMRAVATLPAQVAVNENATVRVQSPVVGRIDAVLVQPGDKVSAGQALARIVSSDLAQAQADQAKAEAALAQLAAALKRTQELFDAKVVAQRDLEQARADEAQARAELDRTRQRVSQLGGTKAATGTYALTAPIAGVVVDRAANPGQEVRNDNGVVLFTVSALDNVWITAQAYERDLSRIAVGQTLEFTTDAVPDTTFVATVTYEGNALDPATRTAPVRATVANPKGRLRPLMFGTARLLAPVPAQALVVASAALVTSGDSTIVFVEESPRRFRAKRVTVADDDGHTAVVTSGLLPGQRVAVEGALLLEAQLPAAPARR